MENRRKIAARAAQWGGGAEMGPMGLMRPMGCDKRVWAMQEQRGSGSAGSSGGAERRCYFPACCDGKMRGLRQKMEIMFFYVWRLH